MLKAKQLIDLRHDLLMPRVRTTTLGHLLLLVRHSGITSLLNFARLVSLLPFPRLFLSLAL